MKKMIMIAVMAVAALSANAQMWVGGELEFSTKHTNGNDFNTKNVTIMPEIGYSLCDNMDVAIAFGYSHASNDEVEFVGDKFFGNSNTFKVNPYVRYKFVKAGNFFAFVDGGVNYSTTHINGVKCNKNNVGLSVAPGIAYSVSDKVTLVSHLGDGLYYNHNWNTFDGNTVTRGNAFGLKLANAISFGAYVAL